MVPDTISLTNISLTTISPRVSKLTPEEFNVTQSTLISAFNRNG
jgi:hypothetical protein